MFFIVSFTRNKVLINEMILINILNIKKKQGEFTTIKIRISYTVFV